MKRGINNPMTPISRFVIHSLAATGDFTVHEIGARTGFNWSAVHRVLAGSGITLPTPLGRATHLRRVARVIAGESKIMGGYRKIYLPFHENARKDWISEHRLVVERRIGRLLTTDELVHHINGDKLEVMGIREHQALHRSGLNDAYIESWLRRGWTQRQITALGVSGHRIVRIRQQLQHANERPPHHLDVESAAASTNSGG